MNTKTTVWAAGWQSSITKTPKLTFTCNEGNLQGEDTTEALKITLSIEPEATGKDGRLKAGTWKIQAVSDSENYNVSFTEGTIKVNPKTVNATWSDTTKLKYNGKPQNVTADLTGVLEGDDCTPAVTGGNAVGPSWSGEAGAKPEKYTANLSLTGEDAGNYQLAEGCESKSYYILKEQPDENEYQFPEKAVLTYGQTLSEATLIGAILAGAVERVHFSVERPEHHVADETVSVGGGRCGGVV